MTEQIKLLGGRLRSLKGWLTQSISACENVVAMPQTLANESFLRGRIENSIAEIDERLKKINDCIGELELAELSQPPSDDRKQREESYSTTRAQAARKHEGCLNSLVAALAELNTIGDVDTTAQPGSIEQDQRDGHAQFKVQDSLKPYILSKENSPLEFSQWKMQFRAFYAASHLERIDVVGQQAFFRKYIESNLMSVLDTKITATTELFDNELAPGTNSCFSELEKEFKLRYPLVARRFQLFSLRQARNESFTEYVAKIKMQATQCDLETLGIEGLLIYIAIVGLNSSDFDLREKLLELSDMTMQEVDRVSRSYESARSAIRGITGSGNVEEGASARRVEHRDTDNDKRTNRPRDFKDYNFDKVKGRTPRERLKLLKESRWCLRCGRHPYDKYQKCWAKSAQCFRCNEIGHLSYLCLEDTSGSSGGSDGSDEDSGEDENSGAQIRTVSTA